MSVIAREECHSLSGSRNERTAPEYLSILRMRMQTYQRTLADPSERGLVMTHSELVLVFPSAGMSMKGLGFSLPFEAGVTCGEGAGEDVEDLLRVELWSASGLRGVVGESEPLAPLVAEPRAFALRSRVARSGLLAVPGERYIERRLV